jgi:hypothetical protein
MYYDVFEWLEYDEGPHHVEPPFCRLQGSASDAEPFEEKFSLGYPSPPKLSALWIVAIYTDSPFVGYSLFFSPLQIV